MKLQVAICSLFVASAASTLDCQQTSKVSVSNRLLYIITGSSGLCLLQGVTMQLPRWLAKPRDSHYGLELFAALANMTVVAPCFLGGAYVLWKRRVLSTKPPVCDGDCDPGLLD